MSLDRGTATRLSLKKITKRLSKWLSVRSSKGREYNVGLCVATQRCERPYGIRRCTSVPAASGHVGLFMPVCTSGGAPACSGTRELASRLSPAPTPLTSLHARS